MADFLIQPLANYTADPNDTRNAVIAVGVADPATITGLVNGTACVARPLVLGPATAAFTPIGDLAVNQTATASIVPDHAAGTVTVTVTAPSWYAGHEAGNGPGVFVASAADLAAGPVSLVPPQIGLLIDADSSDGVTQGDTIGIADPATADSYPGLWLYDTARGVPTISYRWQIMIDVAAGPLQVVLPVAEVTGTVSVT